LAHIIFALLKGGADRETRCEKGWRAIEYANAEEGFGVGEDRNDGCDREVKRYLNEKWTLMGDCLMIKTSTKKLTRTLSTIILFYALMLISYLLFWCSVFPEFIFFEKYYYLFVVNNTLFFASIITNLIVAYSDPGNLTQESTNDPKLDFLNLLQEFSPITLCEHCRIIKTPRTRHCPLCGKCSDRFDHHCPWINNCIGRGNIKRFYLFLTVQACYLVSALYSCIICK
jgi:hypothetical protein